MIEILPWEAITTPVSGYNWLRNSLSSKYRFWWGKSHHGWPALLFEMDSDYADVFRKRRPSVKGIDIDVVLLKDISKQGLIISLTRPSDADIFHRLCLSIVRAADKVDAEGQAVLSVLNHLDRWRDFLANARKRLLSPEESRGLFAELTAIRAFIKDYLLKSGDVVAAWQGPLRKPQDFEFPQAAVEVKAFGGTRGAVVQISSEQQLQSMNCPLYLLAVELFEGGADPARVSLNVLVRDLEELVGETVARMLRDRLAIAGYAEVPEYDDVEFVTGRLETYHVTDEFPAIRSSRLLPGISNVKYSLDLTSVRQFLVPRIPAWNALS